MEEIKNVSLVKKREEGKKYNYLFLHIKRVIWREVGTKFMCLQKANLGQYMEISGSRRGLRNLLKVGGGLKLMFILLFIFCSSVFSSFVLYRIIFHVIIREENKYMF